MTETSKCCERCGREVPTFTLLGTTVAARFCEGCGDVLHAEDERREAAVETRLALDRAGMTRRLSRFTWEDATNANVGRAWLGQEPRPNLILEGHVGTGKTGLAWLIVSELVRSGSPALFVNFRDLLWELRQSFSTNGDGSQLVRRAQTVPVLALDDLGAERPTAWARDELATLVDRRYEELRPTIVTSNYTPSELAARLGHDDPVIGLRIVSRLTEHAQHVKFTGSDRRLQSEIQERAA